MWPNPQETATLVTFIEEILNGKLNFLCSEISIIHLWLFWDSKCFVPFFHLEKLWKTGQHRLLTWLVERSAHISPLDCHLIFRLTVSINSLFMIINSLFIIHAFHTIHKFPSYQQNKNKCYSVFINL